MTQAELLTLPVTVDVPTAGRAFGISRDVAYRRTRAGTFPVPVIRVGSRYVVTRAALLRALGVEDTPTDSLPRATPEQVSA
jgi:hypothetical protein